MRESAVELIRATPKGRMSDNWGLHPFEKLCHVCEMSDCLPSRNGCLQYLVMRKAGVVTDGSIQIQFSWEKMSIFMIKAGLACLLGDLIPAYGLEEMVKKYPQIPLEELPIETPERVMFIPRQRRRRSTYETAREDADCG